MAIESLIFARVVPELQVRSVVTVELLREAAEPLPIPPQGISRSHPAELATTLTAAEG